MNGTSPPRARSATGSGSEPPPSREQINGLGASGWDPMLQTSPPSKGSPLDGPVPYPSRQSSGQVADATGGDSFHRRNLPSLSDVFEGRNLSNGIATSEADGHPAYPRARVNGSPGPPPSLMSGESRSPSLRQEYSTGSASSSYSFPRTPIEGSLPIHALLSGKPGPLSETSVTSPGIPNLLNGNSGYFGLPPSHSLGLVASPQHMGNGISSQRYSARPAGRDGEGTSLDAISALLRAGEIVDQQQR